MKMSPIVRLVPAVTANPNGYAPPTTSTANRLMKLTDPAAENPPNSDTTKVMRYAFRIPSRSTMAAGEYSETRLARITKKSTSRMMLSSLACLW